MKSHLITLLALACPAVSALAQDADIKISEQEIRALGPLPEEKVVEVLKKGERNPFAERAVAKASTLAEDTESEEARLRAVIAKLPLSGRISNSDGRQGVLFGRSLLHEGDKLPPLLPDQTALLRISSINPEKVEISWVEDQASATPRKIVRNIKINEPSIRQVLPSYGEKGEVSSGQFTVPMTTRGEYLKAAETATADEEESGTPPPASAELRSRSAPAGTARSNPLKK